MQDDAVANPDYGRRSLPIAGFIGLVVVWLLVLRGVGLLTSEAADIQDGRSITTGNVFWGVFVPIGAACALVYMAIAVLGWWRPLLYDPKPVRRWVWSIPSVFAVVIVGSINYSILADRGIGFTLTLLVACLFVGFSEEGMFRHCIGVTVFRRHGFTEGYVALWTSLLFGLVHVINIIGGDSKALIQAVTVSLAGYFFYLIRRVSRSNILNSVMHGLFDFALLSGTAIIAEGDKAYPASGLAILAYIVCGIVVLVQRHKIEPIGSTGTSATPTPA